MRPSGATTNSRDRVNLKKTATLLISCPDQKGLNAAIHDFIFRANGNTLHADEHQDADRNLFLMRVEWDLDGFRAGHARIRGTFPADRRPFSDDLARGAFRRIARKWRFSFRSTTTAWWTFCTATAAASSPARFHW